MLPPAGTAILGRLIEPEGNDLTPEAARYFLQLDFKKADRHRVEELSAAAKRGELSVADQRELDTYLLVADLVGLLQSKARRTLKRVGQTS